MKQKNCHRLVYKLTSKQLKKSDWDIQIDLATAMHEQPEIIVALNDSQCIRFIDEINGISGVTEKSEHIQKRINRIKKLQRTRETGMMIRELYRNLYELQFMKDYVCVVMDSEKDYDRANKGFSINGIRFRRLLGTSGGIKNSTIVYVNAEIYPELKRRIDNGRRTDVPMVAAKLEAYQALVCSGSVPIPEPDGIIVVKDCITHFTDDIILINDERDGEPELTYEKDYPIEHADSDGCGLMLPAYSRRVNEYLTGDGEHEISGMNTRYAWNKGMLYTFDFIEFAEKVAGTYEITDVWGQKRDIRTAEVILTESMLKLWMCYNSWEDYKKNCDENGYQFSTPKTTPEELENVRDTNYQYLQSYQFTDEEIEQLCKPTFDEINEVLGMDYRKSLAFLAGFSMDEDSDFNEFADYIQALMIDERMINDPFILRKVWSMITRRIEMAKRGAIRVNGNFAMISGDPYALCQSMFGLEVTGILKAGEVYHKYWIDKGADEIVCFRSPMTCHNNIRRMKLNKSEEAQHWYQYIRTALIYNAWDTSCEAMNGADKDGDTNMCTDNPVLLKNTLNSDSIICIQKKAGKKIVTEEDIIAANKLGFTDEIGVVTNYITSMIERQSAYEEDDEEYKTLAYRIMCGQMYQQNVIDRIKGIVAKPMPRYWYDKHECRINDGDDAETIAHKNANMKIVAAHKPYFMVHVYPHFKSKYNEYINNNNKSVIRRFQKYGISDIDSLRTYADKTADMEEFLDYYERNMPSGNNPCTVNRICWLAEKEFSGFQNQKQKIDDFDCSILKSNVGYSKYTFSKVSEIYDNYKRRLDDFQKRSRTEKFDKGFVDMQHKLFVDTFRIDCEKVCSNEDELCDIVVDLCYMTEHSKQFAWDVSGKVFLNNLLKRNDYMMHYPQLVECNGDFTYCGKQFIMSERTVSVEDDTVE